MKRLLLLLLLLTAAVALAQAEDAAAAVERNAFTYGQAWAANDLGTLDRLVAPEYIHTDGTGHVYHRSDWFDYIRRRTATGANTVKFSDLATRMYGDTAVITGESTVGDIVRQGLKTPGATMRVRFIQVWVKHQGDWQIVAFQSTPEQPSAGRPQ